MRIVFHIPGPLREFADGRTRIETEVKGATTAEALEALWAVCPGVRYRVMDEEGRVREHLNIFVGDEAIRHTGWLKTPVWDRCEIHIIPAVSGG